MTRFIVFASGKGGVGKTTMAVNVAAALHKFGKEVVIVDGNLTTPNVSILLGMSKAPRTLHDVLSGKVPLEKAMYIHASGLKVIPAGLSLADLYKRKQLDLGKVLNKLLKRFEYVIIDCAAGLGKEAREAIRAADEMVAVTNPEIHAVTDTLKIIELAKKLGVKPIGVILNRVTGKRYEMKKEVVEAFLETPIIGVVPEDKAVKKSVALKVPFVYAFPYSKASRAVKKIAAKIAGEDYKGFTAWERLLNFFD